MCLCPAPSYEGPNGQGGGFGGQLLVACPGFLVRLAIHLAISRTSEDMNDL